MHVFFSFFHHFSGIGVFLLYAEEIFKQAHVKSPGLTSSFVTGDIQKCSVMVLIFCASTVARTIVC